MKKLITFYKLAKLELDKVIFPTKEQIRSASISVLVVVSVIAIFLALVDLTLHLIISNIVG